MYCFKSSMRLYRASFLKIDGFEFTEGDITVPRKIPNANTMENNIGYKKENRFSLTVTPF